MKDWQKEAKAVLDECKEILSHNYDSTWYDVRDITEYFIDNLPIEIQRIFELNAKAHRNLEEAGNW